MRISEPHFIPTHVSIPCSNATSPSVSIRSPGFLVHCLSRRRSWPPLMGQLPCPRIVRVLRTSTLVEPHAFCHYYSNGAFGVPRSGTGVRSGGDAGSPSAPASHPSRTPRIHDTARRTRAASRRARSSTLPVERKHRESPPGRQSQPRGVRAHGHHWRLGTGVGQGPGRLQTILPW